MTSKDLQKFERLETVTKECQLAALETYGKFERAFRLAAGMRELQNLITDEAMQPIMALAGSGLGFRTDKDSNGGYPMAVIKNCLIEAVLRGLNPIGNEWNIISGRCYVTKEGLARLVREYPGMSDLALTLGVPKMSQSGGGAIVETSAAWKLNGKDYQLKREIPVKVNSNMGADAILGKATRKLLSAVYQQITGSYQSIDGEADDAAQVINVTPAHGPTNGNGNGQPKSSASKDLNEAIRNAAAAAASDGSVACPKCRTRHMPPVPGDCLACGADLPEVKA